MGAATTAWINPYSATVDPAGKFVYVANYTTGNVSIYDINNTSGTLTSATAASAGVSPTAIVIDPSGKFAYVTNAGSGKVSVYSVNGTTGGMTSIGADVDAGSYPWAIAISAVIQ